MHAHHKSDNLASSCECKPYVAIMHNGFCVSVVSCLDTYVNLVSAV